MAASACASQQVLKNKLEELNVQNAVWNLTQNERYFQVTLSNQCLFSISELRNEKVARGENTQFVVGASS